MSRMRPTDVQADLLVRVEVSDDSWAATLPATPDDVVCTVTLGHPDLVPRSRAVACQRGYRIVGVATAERPVGHSIDVYVPEALHRDAPGWFDELVASATRVFDLRMGPVQLVLAPQLQLHLRAAS